MHPETDGIGTDGVAGATAAPTDQPVAAAEAPAPAPVIGDLVILAEGDEDQWIDDPVELRKRGWPIRYAVVVDDGYLAILPPASAYQLPFRKVG